MGEKSQDIDRDFPSYTEPLQTTAIKAGMFIGEVVLKVGTPIVVLAIGYNAIKNIHE